MNKKKDLEYFMKLNYDAVMRMKDSEYCLFIPELSIIASGKTLDEAYQELINEKEKYFKNVIDLNLQETVNEPATIKIRKKQYQEIFQFVLKIFITFLIFFVLFAIFFLPILSSIEKVLAHKMGAAEEALAHKMETVPEIMASRVVAKIDNMLSNMTEKEKKEMRLKIRNMVQKVKPYSDEIKILFQDDGKMEKKQR